MDHRPASAVSVPCALRVQPRLISRSSNSGPQSARRRVRAQCRVRACRAVDQVEDRAPVTRRLGGDLRVVGVVVAPHGRRLGGVELVGEREDPVRGVQPVDLVAVGDVQLGRLLGRVAVLRGLGAAEGHERLPVEGRHVGRHVAVRVAVGPQDQLAVGVERDVRLDLLDAVDHATRDEVPERARLGRRPGRRAAVLERRRAAGRAAAAAPLVAVVAVEVGADGGRARVRLAVLAPGAERVAGEVEAHPVRVEGEDDEDLAAVDEAAHGPVRRVVAGQPAEGRERLLDREVLARVVERVDEDLGLRLVVVDVVTDLRRPDVPALVALADGEHVDEVGVVRLRLLDLGDHLGQVVVPAHVGREVRLRGGRGRRGPQAGRGARRRGRWPSRAGRWTGGGGSVAWIDGARPHRTAPCRNGAMRA